MKGPQRFERREAPIRCGFARTYVPVLVSLALERTTPFPAQVSIRPGPRKGNPSDVIRGGRFELVDLIGAGDKVVVIMRPPPDGDEPAPAVANLATFRDGKVIEMVHYPNADDALAAAGA